MQYQAAPVFVADNAIDEAVSPMERILTIHVIFDNIFSFANLASMIRFSMACRTTRAAVQSYMIRAFSINHFLSRYFSDPVAFRSLQARTSTLISGSSALQFFDRSYYPGSDLDIYVHMNWRRVVGRWLLCEGYTFVPNNYQANDFEKAVTDPKILNGWRHYKMRGVAAVFNFVKRSLQNPEVELKVQVIVAKESPMEIILCFHSSMRL